MLVLEPTRFASQEFRCLKTLDLLLSTVTLHDYIDSYIYFNPPASCKTRKVVKLTDTLIGCSHNKLAPHSLGKVP